MPEYAQPVTQDGYGHVVPLRGQALTAGAVGTTAAGTIVPTTGAGASPTVTSVTAIDNVGQFTLNPITGGGAQSAGTVAHVYFANGMPAVPIVQVTIYDTANAAAVAAQAGNVTAEGFDVQVGAALTTAHTYAVVYEATCVVNS
jgi:hypothetical protein